MLLCYNALAMIGQLLCVFLILITPVTVLAEAPLNPSVNIVLKSEKYQARKKRKEKAIISQHVISKQQIKEGAVASVFSDTVSVIKTLPGVVGNSDMDAAMYIRGGSPEETLMIGDNHYYQWPYFFGGMVSIMNPELVNDVTFYAGGFPAKYGNVLSGVLDVKTIDGNKKEFKSELNLTTSDVNYLAHGPIIKNRSSWLFSARRTYYDLIFGFLLSESSATRVPFFESYNTKFLFDLTPKHELQLIANNFHDKGDVKSEDEDFFGAEFEHETKINLVDLQVESDWNNHLSSILGVQYEHLSARYNRFSSPRIDFKETHKPLAIGGHFTYTGAKNHKIESGFMRWSQGIDGNTSYTREADPLIQGSVDTKISNIYKPSFTYLGLYIQDEINIIPKKLAVNVGLRHDSALEKNYDKMTSIQPRLLVYVGDREKSVFTASVGKYAQMEFDFFEEDILNLKPSEAIHYNVGYERQWSQSMARIETYHKAYTRLTDEVTDAETDALLGYDKSGTGRVDGVELYYQKKTGGKWDGWLSYTFSRAKYKTKKYGWIHPYHDQRHTLNILGNYFLTPLWKLSTKVAIASGRPYTDITGRTFDTTRSLYVPIQGGYHQARLPWTAKIDLWINFQKAPFPFHKFKGEQFVGVSNILNTVNVIGYDWDDNYAKRQSITLMPRMPIFGMKVFF